MAQIISESICCFSFLFIVAQEGEKGKLETEDESLGEKRKPPR
nr:MAG TPA: hypothetical protein [Caudoviricetes sp.]